MNFLKNLLLRFITYMAGLAQDGGPSVTRWVYLRTAEVVAVCMLALTTCACIELLKHHTVDVALCGLIGALAASMFGFAAGTQKTKIGADQACNTPESGPVPNAAA